MIRQPIPRFLATLALLSTASCSTTPSASHSLAAPPAPRNFFGKGLPAVFNTLAISLTFSHSAEVAAVINEQARFEARYRGLSDPPVHATSMGSSNTVILTGEAAAVQRAEELIKYELDPHEFDPAITFIYPVHHAQAADLEHVMNAFFTTPRIESSPSRPDQKSAPLLEHFAIIQIPSSNSVLITTWKPFESDIRQLLTSLDRDPAPSALPAR
jgi:type II secretory pathway component GspD/PulD (secretin)